MNTQEKQNLLVIRPWLGTISGGEAYANFDALAMREASGRLDRRYGNYRIILPGDDGRRVLRLDNFRFQCQTDHRRPESYAWEWGYQPAHRNVFTQRDIISYGPSIAAIGRALERIHRQDGPPDTVGRYVVRLARVLKLDGIALIETSPTGSFHDEMEIRHRVSGGHYGEAIHVIDELVNQLHLSCVQRTGKQAA